MSFVFNVVFVTRLTVVWGKKRISQFSHFVVSENSGLSRIR